MKTVQTVAAAFTLQQAAPDFDFSRQYLHQEQLYGLEGRPAAAAQPAGKGDAKFGGAAEDDAPPHHGQQWVLLRFSQPIVAPAVRPCCGCIASCGGEQSDARHAPRLRLGRACWLEWHWFPGPASQASQRRALTIATAA